MKETGDMGALIQYIMDYIRSHPDEYREWLKAKGQDEDGHVGKHLAGRQGSVPVLPQREKELQV